MRRRSFITALSALPLAQTVQAHPASTITWSWPVNTGPLNPHQYNPNQLYAQAMLYDPLVRYGAGGRIEPALATAWEQDETGRVWTFRLRQGVRFSDGTAFDAAAVVANVEAVLANRRRHAWLELVAQIDGVEAPDPATIRLHLRDAYYPALQELTLIRPLRFASPAVLRPDGSLAAPVGTGPWRLAESIRGQHDLFVRNDLHWDVPPSADRVMVRVLGDANARALALETGELDLIYGADQVDADTFRRLGADRRFSATISPPVATRMLALNSGRFPTDDPAVRRAIAAGIDRANLVRHALGGTEPAAETLFSEDFPYCRLGLRAPAFDRAAAASLLEAAGWRLAPGARVRQREGKDLVLDLCFVGPDALQKALAEAIQGDLARIGIAARLAGEDASTSEARQRSGEFGMIFGNTWGAPYDPHAFMNSMRAPSHADFEAQRGLPMKAEIDRRIAEVLTTTDEAERAARYRWLLTTLHDFGVYFPVSYLTNKAIQRAGLPAVPFGATRYEIPFAQMRRG